MMHLPSLRMALNSCVVCWSLTFALLISGCGLDELRQRNAALQKLVATNASLSTVKNNIGDIPVYRKNTAAWNKFRATFTRYADPKSKQVLQKIDNSVAVGFTSTMSMQTYIFLDEHDKLVDFIVDSQ